MSVINTNVKALTAQASLSNVNKTMSTAMERLSTGSRINSAKDDAAGLAISLRMTSDIRGFAVAIRNANDGISMSQTAEGGLGQINDMLQRMRELAVQSSNGSASADNRAASQLEVTQLRQEIDNIASRTNFNGIKLLDGTAAKLNLQTGVNSGDMMTMQIAAAGTKDIGLGSRSSLTATGFTAASTGVAKLLAAGDLTINGVTVGASSGLDDNLSSETINKSSSAIAKVAAINLVSAQSGVNATVGPTTVAGTLMGATPLTGSISINGVSTGDFSTTGDAGVSRSNTVAAINLISGRTGVRAVDSGDVNKGVLLVADDGRNVSIAYTTLTAAATGAGTDAQTTTGTYQLTSVSGGPIVLGSSSSGTIANAGLSAGTFEANVSIVTSTARSVATAAPGTGTTGLLQAGTMRINGISIDAAVTASDTSSSVATSSTKAASAIAIAASINAKSELTGVKATAEANTIVGTAFSAAAITAGIININGVDVTLTTTGASTRGDVVTEINKVSGQTGVVASDNGRGLTLTAADGRNISLATDQAGVGGFGLLATSVKLGAAAAAGATTTYAAVSLKSDKSFKLEGGSDGNISFAALGFKTGTVGGTDNGVKVASVDVSTQSGAQVAITALDAAMKSVSMSQAQLGAFQNRLDAVVSNLTVANLNMSASRSRIQDTDYATESTNLAKSQIISQAATAMLAQANQSAQGVLALLK